MSATSPVRVPIGPDAALWNTFPVCRTVLVVVHTVTSVNRLADVLPVFESDPRVQLVFTTPGSSAVSQGVAESLGATGDVVVPWRQARRTAFDLAISAHHSGPLHKLRAPLTVLSHGLGYCKYTMADPRRPVYGMARDWLVRDGRPIADALVLSHSEQVRQLATAAPEAAGAAVVVGDPCFDRMRASLPRRRERYRRALGARADDLVVVLSSTWGPNSLLATRTELPRRLLAELPADNHRVSLVLHPNAAFGHGARQSRSVLADCRRAGLNPVPPAAGWQQAVLAADVLVGDNGSVTGYAAAMGVPTLLAAFAPAEVVPGTAIAALGETAPRLDPDRPLRAQVEAARAGHRPDRFAAVAGLVSSVPDEALDRLRTLCYRQMGLPEPELPAPMHLLPDTDLPPKPAEPPASWVDGEVWTDGDRTTVTLRRLPTDVSPRQPDTDAHLAVHVDHPMRDWRGAAGVLYVRRDELDVPPDTWLSGTLRDWLSCLVAAVLMDDGCLLSVAGAGTLRLTATGPDGPPASAYPSAVYRLLADGHHMSAAPDRFWLDVGHGPHEIRVRPA